jgi:hypothetical protein
MDDEQYSRYTVREAAIRLGLSEAAVRQRIRRHTLVAERSDGIVYVVLADDTPDKTPDNTPFETVSDTPDSTAIMTATQQLEAIRDEWLAPLVAQIAEQAETIGRITAERDQAQRERDDERQRRQAAESRVSELEAQEAEIPVQAPSAPQAATGAATGTPWWAFWKRGTD